MQISQSVCNTIQLANQISFTLGESTGAYTHYRLLVDMRVMSEIVLHVKERTEGRDKCGKWTEVAGDAEKMQHIPMVESGP